jgi:hypothetical protein
MSDSEQFRSTPKTVETSIGKPEVRQTDGAKTAAGGRMMTVAPGEEAACSI